MSKSIYDVKSDIERLLEAKKELRDDDDLLYLEIIREHGKSGVSVDHFLQNRKSMGIPPFETVRRARQKAQAENPELKGTKVESRREAEEKYLEFARS